MSEPTTHEFKAEIKKLLDILSKSLYQHREVFLRELVSNAVDALSKMRFIQLQDKDVEDLPLEIEIAFNAKDKSLHVRDTGVGMTREEIVEQLGTIAGSGSEKFFKVIQESKEKGNKDMDMDIIGQFGVGFYSVFMVADSVEVISRSYKKGEAGHAWVSDGSGTFEVKPVDMSSRGTEVVLHLKDDEGEYLNQYRLESIVKKYSNYVPYPVYVKEEGKTEVDAGEDDETKSTSDAAGESADESATEGGKEGDDTVEPAKEPERKPVNQITPLWKKPPASIQEDEYKEFYHFVSNRYDEFAHHVHYNVDGQVQFNSIVYVPESRTRELMEADVDYGLSLYSKNVLIIERCKDLVPRWLRFVKGIVDSEDVPLNVSRDTIQNNRVVAKISDLLVKKFIGELQDMATKDPAKYKKIWDQFNFFIKEGIVSDYANRPKLMKLLRFKTTRTSGDELKGLDAYVASMKEGQKEIFYLVGEERGIMKQSPHLGYYKKNDIEVILFDDPVDNYLMMNIRDHAVTTGEGDQKKDEHYPFNPIDVTDAPAKTDDKKDEGDTKEDEKPSENVQKFLDRVKDTLGNKIVDAKVSTKLFDSAYRLANPAGGMTSSMQRVMRYWSQDRAGKAFEIPRKVFEINPEHPMVAAMIDINASEPDNGRVKPAILQMFTNALLAEGDLPETAIASMVPRMNQILEMLVTRKDDVPYTGEEEPVEKDEDILEGLEDDMDGLDDDLDAKDGKDEGA